MENRQSTSQQKPKGSLPLKVCDKIKELSQGIYISKEPIDLTIDALIRVMHKYFSEDNTGRELSQFAQQSQKQFYFLTVSEVE